MRTRRILTTRRHNRSVRICIWCVSGSRARPFWSRSRAKPSKVKRRENQSFITSRSRRCDHGRCTVKVNLYFVQPSRVDETEKDTGRSSAQPSLGEGVCTHARHGVVLCDFVVRMRDESRMNTVRYVSRRRGGTSAIWRYLVLPGFPLVLPIIFLVSFRIILC